MPTLLLFEHVISDITEPSRPEELIPTSEAFPKMAEVYRSRIDALDDLFTPAELNLLHKMTDSLPERNTFLHGDFHQGNIMVQGDELLLTDMADTAVGNPFYEVLCPYMIGVRLVQKAPPAVSKELCGWDAPTIYKAWEIFRRHYFQDNIDLTELEDMLSAYSELRYLTFLKNFSVTDEFLHNEAQRVRKDFLPQIDNYIRRFEGILQQDL